MEQKLQISVFLKFIRIGIKILFMEKSLSIFCLIDYFSLLQAFLNALYLQRYYKLIRVFLLIRLKNYNG